MLEIGRVHSAACTPYHLNLFQKYRDLTSSRNFSHVEYTWRKIVRGTLLVLGHGGVSPSTIYVGSLGLVLAMTNNKADRHLCLFHMVPGCRPFCLILFKAAMECCLVSEQSKAKHVTSQILAVD